MNITCTADFTQEHWHDVAEAYEIPIYPNDSKQSLQAVLDFLERNTSVAGVTDTGNIIYYTCF